MRRFLRAASIAILLMLSWLGRYPAGAAGSNRVVLVTIDGLAAYYLQDPRAELPTLHRLVAEGAVADGLRVSNPSTTWANHTTLVTGVHPDKHSVLFNGLLVREGPGQPLRIEADRDQAELVAVPTVYDLLHRAGYRTAAINWPCTRGATTLDDNFPDVPGRISHTTPRLRAELVRDGILDRSGDAGFMTQTPAAADVIWTSAALHLLRVRPQTCCCCICWPPMPPSTGTDRNLPLPTPRSPPRMPSSRDCCARSQHPKLASGRP